MKSINPYTNELEFEHKKLTDKEIREAIIQSDKAFYSWKDVDITIRSTLVLKVADILETHKEKWAKVMTLEMGKPISQAIAEVEKCAWLCRYYAENASEQLAEKYITTDAKSSYIRYEPLGVILGVMPWNYPFWQVFRFAIPTLLAGNTVLLKHASNMMESAKNIQYIFDKAGFPLGVFKQLTIGSDKVENILRNNKVKGVSLTGSKSAGASVAKIAGEEIKPSLLELGGNNALIVFSDADMETALDMCINARYQNTGQSCIAGKRLLLQETIAEDFMASLTLRINALKCGNPLEKDTFIGTMVNQEASKELYLQLQSSLEKGAKLVTGGSYNGAFFEPTLVKDVTPTMPIFKEETFGPLLAVTTFKTEEEAVALANNSAFGLGVSIFTQDSERMQRLIPQMDDGAVFINELVKSDPRLPFGGTKTSGYGRELSREGILAFVNVKTVYVR